MLIINKNNYLVNHENKVFTCIHPVNTFVIDESNGYPVQVTTNVTKNTLWKDIFKGNYNYANQCGTPEYIVVNGQIYIYIDYKYATKCLGYTFVNAIDEPYKSKLNKR